MDEQDYYKILQVDSAAELEVIAAAYKRLAQKYHPDGQAASIEPRRMQDINLAYEVLRDPGKRAQYDRMRALAPVRALPPATTERCQSATSPIDDQTAASPPQLPAQQTARGLSVGWIIAACLSIAALLGSGTALVLRQQAAAAVPVSTSTVWDGECRAPTGYIYACRVRIKISPTNRVTGSILWSLKASPHIHEQLAIGRKARAYIKGTFDPVSRRIAIGSYTEDDPYRMIEVNEYTLSLSADGQTLSGETYNDGVWLGTLSALRKE